MEAILIGYFPMDSYRESLSILSFYHFLDFFEKVGAKKHFIEFYPT